MKKIFWLLLLVMFFTGACSATRITGIQQNQENGNQNFKNILVVSLFLDENIGRQSELALLHELRDKGVAATAGHTVLPAGNRSSVENITEIIGRHSFDGILLSRIVDKFAETRITAKGNCENRWDSDYRENRRYSLSHCPPGSQTSTTAVYALESNLYRAQDGALTISLTSETSIDRPTKKLIQGFAQAVVKHLAAAGMFAEQN
ncbi:MAG TPA: hypothetical protein ENN66_08050 [Proteobacteria bacterium]|nr:hypothetical protein [Pseudomonadota bacterium]